MKKRFSTNLNLSMQHVSSHQSLLIHFWIYRKLHDQRENGAGVVVNGNNKRWTEEHKNWGCFYKSAPKRIWFIDPGSHSNQRTGSQLAELEAPLLLVWEGVAHTTGVPLGITDLESFSLDLLYIPLCSGDICRSPLAYNPNSINDKLS